MLDKLIPSPKIKIKITKGFATLMRIHNIIYIIQLEFTHTRGSGYRWDFQPTKISILLRYLSSNEPYSSKLKLHPHVHRHMDVDGNFNPLKNIKKIKKNLRNPFNVRIFTRT